MENGYKLVQFSTTRCPHCKPAAMFASGALPKDAFVLALLDTQEVVYKGLEGESSEAKEEFVSNVNNVISNAGSIRSVPSFRIVDKDFNIVHTPKNVTAAVEYIQNIQEE